MKKIKVIINIILGITIFVILDIFFTYCHYEKYKFMFFNMFFPIILSAIIFSLFWGIFKHTSKAIKWSYIIIFIIGVINLIKVDTIMEPLYLTDISFLLQAENLADIAFSNISANTIKRFLFIPLCFAVILILLYFLSKKVDIKLKNMRSRIIIIIVDIIILLLLFIPTKVTKDLYLKIFFNTEELVDYRMSYGTNFHYYMSYGCTAGTWGVHLNRFFIEPKGYDEEQINKDIEEVAKNYKEKKTLNNSNIVVVFSESFWDIDQLEEVKFDKKILSNFYKLKEEGKFVNLLSPTYGGLSENVTHEFFTGSSMSYFSQGYIPIMSLYGRRNSRNMPSLIRNLKDSGYESSSLFVHDYYSTEKSFKKMGLDYYVELHELEPFRHLNEYTDKRITDLIITDLERNRNGILNFYSMHEGHVPYNNQKYTEYDVSIVESNLKEEENEVLRVHAQALHNADKELIRLYNYIQTLEEDTMLIFLGDHLPYILVPDQINLIDKLEFFNTDNELLNYYRRYNTPGLILSNFNMDDFEIPETLGTDFLFAYILNHMKGVETDDYYKWLENYSKEIRATNKYITIDKDNNLYSTQNLTEDLKKKYNYREMVQYKYFIK